MDTQEVSLNGPFPLASFWIRLFGRAGYLFIALFVVLVYLLTRSFLLSYLLGFVLGSAMDSYVGSKLGAPLGEFILMLKTVDIKTGEKADFNQLFRRRIFLGSQSIVFYLISGLVGYLVYKISGLNYVTLFKSFGLQIPFLALLLSPYKQTLYDMASGVIVVNTSPYYHPRYPLQILPQE